MIRFLLVIMVLTFSTSGQSQNSNDVQFHADRKLWNHDTTKYKRYDRVLIIGISQQYRSFETTLAQKMNPNDSSGLSDLVYVAESDFTGSMVFSYDKFQFSIGSRNKPDLGSDGKGYTKMFNMGVSVGDNRWLLENYYRRFQGFYNKNQNVIDTVEHPDTKYYLQPGLISSLFSSRFMYFDNYENFSYRSGFGCNYRQLRSSATWIFGGCFNVYNFKNDSSIIPMKSRPLYNDYANLRGFSSVNLAFNAGAAATIVLFKAWYMTGYFTLGPEQQWRNYDLTSYHRRLSYVSWSGTGRFSMGLNMKRMYIYYAINNDYNLYDSKNIMQFRMNSITHQLAFGWRFHLETPKFYQKFMESKLYSLL